MTGLLERLITYIAPHDCMMCGVEGHVLCPWCLPDALPLLPSRCYRCKRVTDDWSVCVKCRHTSPLRRVMVRTEYDGVAKDLINKIKFERVSAAAEPIARAFDDIETSVLPEVVVCEVPTATGRVRQRGYDQARLIAETWARARGVRRTSLLRRVGQTRQVGASREQRKKQAAEQFMLRPGLQLSGVHVLLIDDVVTTGATIEAAARCFRAGGASSVSALVFAQKSTS